MVAITQRVEVCDICRDVNRPVKHFRLAPESGRLRKLALCDEHSEPIKGLVEALSLWSEGSRRSRQVTMEQIEQVKKTQKRAAKKTAAKTS